MKKIYEVPELDVTVISTTEDVLNGSDVIIPGGDLWDDTNN